MNLQTGISYTRWLLNGTLLYLLLPFLLFLAGWIRPLYAVPACLLLLVCAYQLIDQTRSYVIESPSGWYQLGVLLLAAYWCFIAGLGEWMPQSSDFFKHNLIFGDLVRLDWPVRYELPNKSFLCYYLAWYLPVALVGKLIGLRFVPLLSFVWSLGALYLIFNWVSVVGGRYRLGALAGFALLSGFNLIRFIIQWLIKLFSGIIPYETYKSLPPLVNYPFPIKQWLYIPQQVIGAWLVMGWVYVELFQRKRYNSIFFIIGLGLFYSPFAIFGLTPLLIAGWPIHWRQFLSIPNLIGFPIIFFFIGGYYSAHYPLQASGWNIPFTLPKLAFLINTLATDIVLPFLFIWLLRQRYKVLNHKQMVFISIASVLKIILAFYFVGYNNDLLMNAAITASSLLFIFMGMALQQVSETPSLRPTVVFITLTLIIVSALPVYLHTSQFINYAEIKHSVPYRPTLMKASGHTINDLNTFMHYRFKPNEYYDFSQQYLGNPNHFFNRGFLEQSR